MLSPPHPTHPSFSHGPNTEVFITEKLAQRPRMVVLSPSPLPLFLLPCQFYAYVQRILRLNHGKKFNLFFFFFIKVQLLPCQSNPFISLRVDWSCQAMITVRYLRNGRLIIPTSEKLPFVNYIATNEGQMHPLQCPLSRTLSLALCHAQEPNHKASAGI